MVKFKYFLGFLFILTASLFSQTHVSSGNVSGKWIKQNSPYYIDGEIKISRGKKLIIEPGVKIIFTGHYKMIINGILEAKGTKQDSIYFFPGDTSVGWHGIRFIKAEDLSTLEHCVLSFGKTAFHTMKYDYYDKCESDPECDELDYNGGVILIYHSNPLIKSCKIYNNLACWDGGGIDIRSNSNPEISFCEIKNNIAYHDGGGLKASLSSSPMVENCTIKNNYAGNMGGGLYIGYYSNVLIDSCMIEGNIAKARGGGISFYTSAKPVVINSRISCNSSPLGGGIYIDEFYNEFREQPDKIDIRITNVRIENNNADYGGGIWLRDTQGELSGVTICNNKAMIGGGINIEHNPMYLKFSSENPCNIYMNFAQIMGNDLFRLGGEKPTDIPLDTFTVKYYSALNVEPVEKFPLTIKNFKLTQVNADLYVSPDGDNSNSGLSSEEPLKSLKIAFLKILADSLSPRTIYMDEGEYIFSETNDALMLAKHKYVSLKGLNSGEVILSTDRIIVIIPWGKSLWAYLLYEIIGFIIIIGSAIFYFIRYKLKYQLKYEYEHAKKLEELTQLKCNFFANISHEFRTPLTLILGPAKQLLERFKDDKAVEQLNLIHRSAKKLNRLVDELLDISKIESGEMKLKACPVNLVSVVREMVLSFQALAERKKITFKLNTEADEIFIYVDKDKFDKILSNVLSNAIKFTPENGCVEVVINCHPEPALPAGRLVSGSPSLSASPSQQKIPKQVRNDYCSYVEISIRDTGIGIPKDLTDKIFDRFYQVDGSHTRKQGGTGIGLSLTKELMELHKGWIEVESEEGKGSTFKLIFPLGKDHLKLQEICEEEFEKEQEKGKSIADLDEFVERKGKHKIDFEVSG